MQFLNWKLHVTVGIPELFGGCGGFGQTPSLIQAINDPEPWLESKNPFTDLGLTRIQLQPVNDQLHESDGTLRKFFYLELTWIYIFFLHIMSKSAIFLHCEIIIIIIFKKK